MNGYNFTEGVRRALAMAREEAFALGHQYVGTEHMLLGVLRDGEGIAIAMIEKAGAVPAKVRETLLATLQSNDVTISGPDLPYTSRAKKVLELAMSEARDLHHGYVGTEHLLLGLIGEKQGIAAQVLTEQGMKLADAREEMLRLLGKGQGGERAKRPAPPKDIDRIVIEVHFHDGTSVRTEAPSRTNALWFLARL